MQATMISQLKHQDPNVRSSAVLALGKSGDQDALPYLIDVLCHDPELSLQEDATWSLVRFGVDAVPDLLALLEQDSAHIRHNAVHALGKIGSIEAVPALVKMLNDTDRQVRLKAVYALGQIGDDLAITPLIDMLVDPHQEVQTITIDVLLRFGAVAIPELCDALQHQHAIIREHVAGILGQIGDAEAVDVLANMAGDSVADVRLSVAQALGEIGDSKGVIALSTLSKDEDVRVRAMARAMLKQFA